MIFESVVGELVFIIIIYGLQWSFIIDHPMVFGGMLLTAGVLSTGLVCLYCGPLFAAFYFLIMVSGVLIVFAYTISLVPYDLAVTEIEAYEVFNESDPGMLYNSFLAVLWWVVCVIIMINPLLLAVSFRWWPYYFTWLFYFSSDWGFLCAFTGLGLLSLIVSVVGSVWGYDGALVAGMESWIADKNNKEN